MKITVKAWMLGFGLLVACGSDDDAEQDDLGSSDGAAGSSSDGGDESEGEGEESSEATGAADDTSDPFAECDRGTLEADLSGQDGEGNPAPVAWMGPGVDPATGQLIDDGGTYVVSTTYLTMKPDPAAQQKFGELMGPIMGTLMSSPGAVAVQLGVSPSCATARTFTVWEDEAAMMQFVTSDAHSAAMAAVGEISRGQSVVTHWTGATVPEITWDEALERIAADPGPFY